MEELIMKKSGIVISIMMSFMFVFFSISVLAQTDSENHAHLSSLNQSIMVRANAIATGETKSRNDQITQYNEFRKSLAEAKKTHNLLKKVIPQKAMSDAIIHHDNIDKFYSTATTYANSMAEDLKNENTDESKLKEHAKKFYDEIALAEKEHQALIKVTR